MHLFIFYQAIFDVKYIILVYIPRLDISLFDVYYRRLTLGISPTTALIGLKLASFESHYLFRHQPPTIFTPPPSFFLPGLAHRGTHMTNQVTYPFFSF